MQVAENNSILTKTQLKEVFLSNCKTEQKIGLEFEKLPVYKNSFEAVRYQDIKNILMYLTEDNWLGIYNKNDLIGLTCNIGTITLEPGSQFELSLKPFEDINEIHFFVQNYNEKTSQLAEKFGIYWLGYGVQPKSTYENIKIIPKERYEQMTVYFQNKESMPYVMMRETAGIQVNFDYNSEQDAIDKLSLALKMSPFITALYSNSPIRNSKLTSYKSFRAESWLHTDFKRCGLVSEKLFDKNYEFTFDDYVDTLLGVPTIFIERENIINTGNLTFREFLNNGYLGYKAELKDWLNHISLYFPDVRLKSYLEIRNHDSQRNDLISSVPAFWKGILYNKDAFYEVQNILNKFSYFDYLELRENVPKYAINSKILKYNVRDILLEIFNISYQSLKSFGKNEQIYIDVLFDLLSQGITPADIIIKNWQGRWNNNIANLIEYTKL